MCFVCRGSKEWQPPQGHQGGPIVLQCDTLTHLPENSLSLCGDVWIVDCPLLETIGSQQGVGVVRGRRSRLMLQNLPLLKSIGSCQHVAHVRMYNAPSLLHVPVFASATCMRLGDLASLTTLSVQPVLRRLRVLRCSSLVRLDAHPRLERLDLLACHRLACVRQPIVTQHSWLVVWIDKKIEYRAIRRKSIWCAIQINDCRCITQAPFDPLDVAVSVPGRCTAMQWTSLAHHVPRHAWEYSLPWLNPTAQRIELLKRLQRWWRKR